MPAPNPDTVRNLFSFPNEAALPNSGLNIADRAYCEAEATYWKATSATTWGLIPTVATHEATGDPHTGYLTPAEHTTGLSGHHAQQHGADAAADHTFPGGTTTFLRADGTFATPSGGGGGAWTTVVKTADTARTNNTVSADPHLVATLAANTNYTVRLMVQMVTNATADSRYQLTFGGTTTRVRRRIFRTSTGDASASVAVLSAFDAAPVVLSTTGLNPYVEEHILLQVGASGGTLAFQWAQVTTDVGATTVLEGSYLEYAVS